MQIKVEAVSSEKTKIKTSEGKIIKCSDKVGAFVKPGSSYTIEKKDDNGVVVMVKNVSAGGGKGKPSGGKGGYKDNTVGMAIGAAVNNALSLMAQGVIAIEDVPRTVVSIYFLSEKGKKLASEGKISELNDYPFKLKVKSGAQASPAASGDDFGEDQGDDFGDGSDDFSEAAQEASGSDDSFGGDFDDDIPF